MPTISFVFELDPVEPSSHGTWASLSSGWFDLRIDDFSVLGEARSGVDGIHYQVAQFWSEFLEVAPYALEAVPADLIKRVESDSWDEFVAHAEEIDAATAVAWWHHRKLEMDFLGLPDLRLISGQDVALLTVAAGSARRCLQVSNLRAALERFDREFVRRMKGQIDHANQERYYGSEQRQLLVQALNASDTALARRLAGHLPTDWAAIRSAVHALETGR